MYDVALIYQSNAGVPADWRGDRCVAELHPGILDRRLVAFDCRLQLSDRRFLVIYGLLRRELVGYQVLVTLQIESGVAELRLILRFLGDRLVERRLKRPRIDLCEEVSGLDHLAFGEVDVLQFAVDP